MLILNRRVGESIIIGEDVKVTLLAQTKKSVKIGIDAPDDVEIDREEIRERKIAERRE